MRNPIRALSARVAAAMRSAQEYNTRPTFLAMAELVRRHANGMTPPPGTSDLTPFELRVFSQNGEDGVIAELLLRIGLSERSFVEFGVGTGHEGNCVFLADVLGWSGLFIEADDASFSGLEHKYGTNDRVTTLHSAITPENVEHRFDSAGVPAELDVLSIDIDGNDYWVWSAIQRFRPRIVVIEYNSALGSQDRLVQRREERAAAYDSSDGFGASIAALKTLAREKGYRFVHTDLCGVNAFFVRADVARELPPESGVPMRSCNFDLLGRRHRPSERADRVFIDLDQAPSRTADFLCKRLV